MCVCIHLTDVSVIKQNFRQSIKFAAAHTSSEREIDGEYCQRERQRESERVREAGYIFLLLISSALWHFMLLPFAALKRNVF